MKKEMIRRQLSGAGPFLVRTSDGKEFTVPYPEFVLVGRHNLAIEDEEGVFDIIDPMHVVSIRPVRKRRKSVAG